MWKTAKHNKEETSKGHLAAEQQHRRGVDANHMTWWAQLHSTNRNMKNFHLSFDLWLQSDSSLLFTFSCRLVCHDITSTKSIRTWSPAWSQSCDLLPAFTLALTANLDSGLWPWTLENNDLVPISQNLIRHQNCQRLQFKKWPWRWKSNKEGDYSKHT